MSVYGIGTDIIEIKRISNMSGKARQALQAKVLLPPETQGRTVDDAFLAKRFAAKEAISKAYGTGIGEKLAFHDIEVTSTPLGQPIARILHRPDLNVLISIADENEYAIAYAVITTKE